MSQLPVPHNSLSTYMVEINRVPLLSRQEEQRLALRYRETGNTDAAHALVTSNLRFVVKIANEYAGYGLRMGDLVQEGNIGLMQAVKKFDPQKGFRLISYAVWWIRAYIQNFILKSWSLVKIGTTQAQRKLFYKLNQAKRKISQFIPGSENLNSESSEALASHLNVKGSEVMEMEARLKSRDASLDQPLGDENRTTHLERIRATDNQEEEVAQAEERSLMKSSVQKALTVLNDREKFIVKNRIMADEPLTLQDIGDRYKISRERARQIEEAAKRKMRLVLQPTPS